MKKRLYCKVCKVPGSPNRTKLTAIKVSNAAADGFFVRDQDRSFVQSLASEGETVSEDPDTVVAEGKKGNLARHLKFLFCR